MTLDQQFLAAAQPEPVRLLGQRLEDYSVGHELLLRRHENVFRTGQPADLATIKAHLFMGVWICCQTWTENQQALKGSVVASGLRPDSAHSGASAHSADATSEAIREWQQHCGPFDLEQKANVFAHYIAAGSIIPLFHRVKQKHQRDAPKPGAPLLALLIEHLLRRENCGLTEALDLPLGLAWWLYLTYWEGEGAIRIYSQADLDQDAAVRELCAKEGLTLLKARV